MTAIAPLWMPTLPHIAIVRGRRRRSPVTLIGSGSSGVVALSSKIEVNRTSGSVADFARRRPGESGLAPLSASKPEMYEREPTLRLASGLSRSRGDAFTELDHIPRLDIEPVVDRVGHLPPVLTSRVLADDELSERRCKGEALQAYSCRIHRESTDCSGTAWPSSARWTRCFRTSDRMPFEAVVGDRGPDGSAGPQAVSSSMEQSRSQPRWRPRYHRYRHYPRCWNS